MSDARERVIANTMADDAVRHFYVYEYRNGHYVYERTCGTEEAAIRRVAELGDRAIYLIDHLIHGAFY